MYTTYEGIEKKILMLPKFNIQKYINVVEDKSRNNSVLIDHGVFVWSISFIIIIINLMKYNKDQSLIV